MPDNETIQKVIVIDRAELAAVQEQAARDGVEVSPLPVSGVEPVTTVALILIGTALAVSAIEHFIDARKGGQVIDLRPGAPATFYRSPGIIYGLVIVLAVDGTVTVEVKEPKGTFGTVIEALRQLTAGITEATIEVIGEVLKAGLDPSGVIVTKQPAGAGEVAAGEAVPGGAGTPAGAP
jgi:hypothetical protein